MMEINERGNKKWVSLMLPEHVQMLEELEKREERKEKPILDEQQIAENYMILQEALQLDLQISVKYFADYDYNIVEGYLLTVDVINKIIYLEEMEIMFDDVMEVVIL